MKVCITSSGETFDSALDPRFGRCPIFIIADLDTNENTIIPNEAVLSSGGAGIGAGQIIINNNIDAVITGNVGINAMKALKAAGIEIYKGKAASVKENISLFKANNLEKIDKAVDSHFGMGSGNRS